MARRRNLQNLVGQKFGKLFVESIVPNTYPTKYNVVCECGTTKQIRGTNMTYSHVKSCGCMSTEWRAAKNRKPAGTAGRNKVLDTYKRSAKARGYVFDITNEQAFDLFESPCYYCGVVNYNRIMPEDAHGTYQYNGIDRLNNTQGYVEGNIVACCGRCNRAKDIMSPNEFN